MKKVFAIILIMVLLLLSIFPSFADSPLDYQIYIDIQSADFVHAYVYNSSFATITSRDPLTVDVLTYGSSYFLYGVNIGRFHFISGRRYFIFYNRSPSDTSFTIDDPRLYLPTIYSPTVDLNRTVLVNPVGHIDEYTLFSFYVIDITDTAFTTVSECLTYYTNYLDLYNAHPYVSGYYHLSDTFTPLGQFYANIWHSFDWLGELYTTHSALLVCVSIALAMSGITLVVILVIKRFKE